MKKILLSLLTLALLPAMAHANGDPVISYSASIRSCNPIPLKVTEVQVVREDLDISIAIPYSAVRVAYRLKNNSGKDIHVDYGFPVDFSGKADGPYGFDGNDMNESLQEVGVADRAVRNVRFRLDGAERPWTRADEVVKTGITYEDEETGQSIEIEEYRLWTYTVLDIPAGETVVLEVEYEVLSNWETALGALQGSPLSRYYPSSGDFYYDFSPAKHWGNGTADVFSCTLRCDALPDAFFFEDDTPQLHTEQAPFVKFNRSTWTCNAVNFNFESAHHVVVRFWKRNDDGAAPYPYWGNPLADCAVPASDYTLTVSGAQPNYPAANMQDNNLATAWVAPGNGVGSTIDIDFPKPRRVSDIGFYNGYHKSATLWGANSRIKRLRLEVTRADGYQDEPVDIDVSGADWSFHYYLLRESDTPRFGEISMLPITTLNRQFEGRMVGENEDGIILYNQVPFSSEAVAHIRITVLSVSPGTKYSDLCISELLVLDGFSD